jgi:ketosteroid isomerase-like protein
VTPEQVGRFFAALAGGDADTLRENNAPDSVNWHSDDPPDIVRL